MKKYVSLLLALAMVLSLAACGKPEGSDAGGPAGTPAPVPSAKPTDKYDDWSDDDYERVRFSRDVSTGDLDATLFVEYSRGDGRSPYLQSELRDFNVVLEGEKAEPAPFDPATVDIWDFLAAVGGEPVDLRHHWDYGPSLNDDVRGGVEEFWSMEAPVDVYITRDGHGGLMYVRVEPYEYWDGEAEPYKSAWEAVQSWIGDFGQWTYSDGQEDVVIDGYRYRYYPDDMALDVRPAGDGEQYRDSYDTASYVAARDAFDALVSGNREMATMFGDWLRLDEEDGVASGALAQDRNRMMRLSIVETMEDRPSDSDNARSRSFTASAWYENGDMYKEFEVPRESMHKRSAGFTVKSQGDAFYTGMDESWDFFGTSEAECRKWLNKKMAEFGCEDVAWEDGQAWDVGVAAGSSKEGSTVATVTPYPDLEGYVGTVKFGIYAKSDDQWAADFKVEF